MIYLVVLLSISLLLIYGSWRDWHHARVSNKITFSCIALALISIPYVNNYIFRGLLILVYLLMFRHALIGGADAKILIAVIISAPNPFLFMSTFIIYSLILAIQKRVTGRNKGFAKISNGTTKLIEERIPGFVPITMSYIITIILTMTAAMFI